LEPIDSSYDFVFVTYALGRWPQSRGLESQMAGLASRFKPGLLVLMVADGGLPRLMDTKKNEINRGKHTSYINNSLIYGVIKL